MDLKFAVTFFHATNINESLYVPGIFRLWEYSDKHWGFR
jgi:hypothetical protein